VFGFAPAAFEFAPKHGVTLETLGQLTPGRYLSSPALWIGLILAALFVGGAIRLRRYSGPL
jgi:hypothetical protein